MADGGFSVGMEPVPSAQGFSDRRVGAFPLRLWRYGDPTAPSPGFHQHRFFIVLMFIFVQIGFCYYAPPDGGSGTWVWFRYTVHVTDPSNAPVANVQVEMTANYSLKMGLQWQDQVVFVSGVTDPNGNVTLIKAVDVTNYWPDNYIFIDMSVNVTEPGYSVLSSEGTYTHFPSGSGSLIIIHDEDSNGIPDSMELPLAEKFSPIFKFHKNNILFPVPIEAVYGGNNSILKDNSSGYIPLPITIHNSQEWRSFFINTVEPNISLNINANGFHPTIYAHSFSNRYSDYYGNLYNYYIIQYWMYYPFNDASNVHEGDWEHVDLIVDGFDPNTAQPVGIIYYHHNTSTPYNWNQINVNNYHPYVFVGGRQEISILFGGTKTRDGYEITGANYPSQGWHYLVDYPKTFSEGFVDGVSLRVADEEVVPGSRILNYDEYKIVNVSMAHPLWWMGYSGRWGADSQTVKNNSFFSSFSIIINVPYFF